MYVSRIRIRGHRDLPDATLHGLGRVVDLCGPTPATTALGDGLELAFAALSEAGLSRLLQRWGLGTDADPPGISGEVFPDEAAWQDQVAARALVDGGSERLLQVELDLELDPPLFGSLRAEAAREPRLVEALADGARVTFAVGCLFTRSFDALAISMQRFSIGAERFPTSGAERPAWLTRFLRQLSDRFQRHDPASDPAERALAAATSRTQYAAYAAWQTALGEAGPRLRAARGPGDTPVLLGDDLPLRRFGAVGRHQAALAADIHLHGADILWAESAQPLLADAVTGDGSPLEQCFRVHAAGTQSVTRTPDQPAADTRRRVLLGPGRPPPTETPPE